MYHPVARKPVSVAGWRNKPQSACRDLFRFMTRDFIQEIIIGKKSDIDTFVNTAGNMTQTALGTLKESCPV